MGIDAKDGHPGGENLARSSPENVEKRRESFIKRLENNTLLFPQDKGALLLVSLGIKPATEFIIPVKYNDNEKKSFDYNKETFQSDMGVVEELLLESRLPKKSKNVITGRIIKHVGGQNFLVGRDEESLEKLLDAKDTKAEGLALGFPKTAIEAFPNNLLDLSTLPAEDSQFYENFSFFSLSKSNWKKELEVIKNWASIIQKISPKLYQEILNDRKEILLPDGYYLKEK